MRMHQLYNSRRGYARGQGHKKNQSISRFEQGKKAKCCWQLWDEMPCLWVYISGANAPIHKTRISVEINLYCSLCLHHCALKISLEKCCCWSLQHCVRSDFGFQIGLGAIIARRIAKTWRTSVWKFSNWIQIWNGTNVESKMKANLYVIC